MDWNKSKNIILLILLITNIFLIAVYGIRNQSEGSDDYGNAYQYTMSVLEENNIYYEGEIYSKLPKVSSLTVSYSNYDSEQTAGVMKKMKELPASSRSDAAYKAAADNFIESCGFMTENVEYSGIETNGSSVTVSYENRYKDIPVEECYMRVYFEDGRITDFDRKWLDIVSEGDSRLEVTSQLSAMLTFMTEADTSERITITDMQMVYWIDSYDVEGDVLYDTALPAWRIKYISGNDTNVKYISATVQ